ncbi:hypothetical protein SBD_7746 [Streptomyces bottropensis ATCC 25435]|uniref:Uncharacterized protein n=1 Tax=Streptomyces bottropensis ATCC 25435 TaxID=1054862 RepID=M3FG90_9ACTN|nr:hypothetical protein SBD_7746 [Streptomyces bottropensis ATCC 25435]
MPVCLVHGGSVSRGRARSQGATGDVTRPTHALLAHALVRRRARGGGRDGGGPDY